MNKKILAAKDANILRKEEPFDIFFRQIENNLRCYREENIPIQTNIQLNRQKFGMLSAAIVVEVEEKELT